MTTWTKGKLVERGYSSIGLTKFAFTLTPEMIAEGLDALDSMIAQWNTQYGIRIGYNLASNSTDAQADQESGIPDHAYQAVYLSLGELIGGTIGKSLAADKQILKREAFDALLSYCASRNIPEVQHVATMPRGSGNKPGQFGVGAVFYQPRDRLDTGTGDGFLDGNDGTPLDAG